MLPPKLADPNAQVEIFQLPESQNLLLAYLRLLFALSIPEALLVIIYLGIPRPSRLYGLLQTTTTQKGSTQALLPGTLLPIKK